MSDTCGPMYEMPLAQYDPDGPCWKTSEVTSLWALPMSSLTLPTWGCLRDGALYELPTPERPTIERDCSSLPTPTSQAAKHPTMDDRGPGTPDDANLWSVVGRLLPTPINSDYNTPASEWMNDHDRLQLRDIHALLPTPAVNDMGAGKDPQAWDEWAARQKAADGRPAPHGKSLEQEALKMLPTPRTTDGTDAPANLTPSVQAILSGEANRTPRLSEMAMDWHGANMPQPSPDGNTPSDDQHQRPLFDETTATD
jgi:hypothetical protein